MPPLIRTKSNATLRAALERITSDLIGDDVGRQVQSVAHLRSETQHSIALEKEAMPADPATFRFTCFQYAFELTNPPLLIVDIATIWRDVFPNAKFVLYLIRDHLHEVDWDVATEGDIVVYLDAGLPKHAGRIRDGSVVSKWGRAHTWRHGVYEVPAGYGDEVRFFRPLSRDEAQEAFLRFAELETGQVFLSDE